MSEQIKDSVIYIDGFKFDMYDSIYQVSSKYDADAPSGYKQYRTTKELSKTTGRNSYSAILDPNTNLWDTGLYAESAMFNGMSKDKIEERLKKVQKYIVEPFEKKFGKEKLDHTKEDSDFWNKTSNSSFNIEVYKDKVFNTNKPEEALQLYIAISKKLLCPKKHEDSPHYGEAQFCIENKDESKSIEQENDFLEVETIGVFRELLDEEKKLRLILNYLGLKISENTFDRKLITTVFKRFVEHSQRGYENKKKFMEAYEKSKDPEGFEELTYYKELQKMHKKGIVKKHFDKYLLDDDFIGNSLKEAAKNISNDNSLKTKVLEIMK